MNASKEKARKALKFWRNVWDGCNEAGASLTEHMRNERLLFVSEFLHAAERKLPTEAAYERDAARRKQKAKA